MGRRRQLAQGNGVGECVWYVMARDQRVDSNHALAEASKLAAERHQPLAVVFCLQRISQAASREQYQFMIDGLRLVEDRLLELGVPFLLLLGAPRDTLAALAHHTKPSAVVFDMSPLRGPRSLHEWCAERFGCDVFEVDTHNIVPVWDAYSKAAYGARILRPHIHRLVPRCIDDSAQVVASMPWPGTVMSMGQLAQKIDEVVCSMPVSGVVSQVESGEIAAHTALRAFIAHRLRGFAEDRNNPAVDGLSGLSPYVHYGHISSRDVIVAAREAVAADEGLRLGYEALFEELVVRKELSDNFCWYQPQYDSLDAAPDWARRTLAVHSNDEREAVYTFAQLRDANTHDTAWNAAQRQMTRTGKMHGYMRMYWAKKALEWSPVQPYRCEAGEPVQLEGLCGAEWAMAVLIYLNDFYSLDGRDPNGYVGIAWAVAGVHDRPWATRNIFGSVRYMNAAGLKRKFPIDAYVTKYS
jgi:deoxyribodipyrimidine photo-lyase